MFEQLGTSLGLYHLLVSEKFLCANSMEHEGPFVSLRNILGDEYHLCTTCFYNLLEDTTEDAPDATLL